MAINVISKFPITIYCFNMAVPWWVVLLLQRLEFHSMRSCQAGFLVVRFVTAVAAPTVEDTERAGVAVLGMERLTSFLLATERILLLSFEGDAAIVLRDVGWIFFHAGVLDGVL